LFAVIRHNLLIDDPQLLERVNQPYNLEVTYTSQQPVRDSGSFLSFMVPYIVTMLFYMVILTSASMMLNSITTEKEKPRHGSADDFDHTDADAGREDHRAGPGGLVVARQLTGLSNALKGVGQAAADSFGFEAINRGIVKGTQSAAEALRATQTGLLNWNIFGIIAGLIIVLAVVIFGG